MLILLRIDSNSSTMTHQIQARWRRVNPWPLPIRPRKPHTRLEIHGLNCTSHSLYLGLTSSKRHNKRPVVEGNNNAGKKGKRRCDLCRKRHLRVLRVEGYTYDSAYTHRRTLRAIFVASLGGRNPVSRCGVRKRQKRSKSPPKQYPCLQFRYLISSRRPTSNLPRRATKHHPQLQTL